MDTETLRNFIIQFTSYLKEDALAAQSAYLEEDDEKTKLFKDGVLMGYVFVISAMQQLAEGFDIPLQTLNLDDIDPEKDLLNATKKLED